MLDQNIVTPISTLAGVALGAGLGYFFASRLEEKTKKREAVEKLYELTLKIHTVIDKYISNGPYVEPPRIDSDSFLIMEMLADLYLRSQRALVKEFSSRVDSVIIAHRGQFSKRDGYGHSIKEETDAFRQAKESYMESYTKLTKALQKLAK